MLHKNCIQYINSKVVQNSTLFRSLKNFPQGIFLHTGPKLVYRQYINGTDKLLQPYNYAYKNT